MVTLHSQAQMRDLSGFVETRQQLLTLKPNHRMNWIGFSVAHHLNSKYDLNLYWIIFSQMVTAMGLKSFFFVCPYCTFFNIIIGSFGVLYSMSLLISRLYNGSKVLRWFGFMNLYVQKIWYSLSSTSLCIGDFCEA